jgi:hypothetical protein
MINKEDYSGLPLGIPISEIQQSETCIMAASNSTKNFNV